MAYKEHHEIKIPVSVGIERGLVEEFDKVCNDAGISRSVMVAQLMRDFIGNDYSQRRNKKAVQKKKAT